MSENLKNIALTQIVERENSLRTLNSDSEEYHELVESVRDKGVLEPIQVVDRGDGFFILVNGLHRYHASVETEKGSIDCKVIDADEREARRLQLTTNAVRVTTKPAEYSKALQQMLTEDPFLTASQLAKEIGKSVGWLNQRLRLNRLCDAAAQMVDEGDVNLANAYKLAELSKEVQEEYLQDAQVQTADEFGKIVEAKIAQIAAERAAGNASAEPVFIIKPKRRVVADLEKLLDNPELVEGFFASSEYEGIEGPVACFSAGIQYALSIDPITEAQLRAEWEENLNGKEEKRRKRRVEALEKKKALKEKRDELEAGKIAIEIDAMKDGKSQEEIAQLVHDYMKLHGILPKKKKKKVEAEAEEAPVEA